jgi:hypothetical protein
VATLADKTGRASAKLSPSVKNGLTDIRKAHGLKTDSEAIAYLLMFHDWGYGKISAKDHKEVLQSAKHYDRQIQIQVKPE